MRISAGAAIEDVVTVSAVEGIIPAVAEQLVVAEPAGEDVGATVTGQSISQRVARRIDVRRPGQRDVLDAVLVRPRRRESDRGIDEVGPSIRGVSSTTTSLALSTV